LPRLSNRESDADSELRFTIARLFERFRRVTILGACESWENKRIVRFLFLVFVHSAWDRAVFVHKDDTRFFLTTSAKELDRMERQ